MKTQTFYSIAFTFELREHFIHFLELDFITTINKFQ